MKEMEKEEDKEDADSDKPEKCEEEAEVSTEGGDKGASLDPPLQPLDSPTSRQPDPPTDIDASIQKTNLNSSQAVVEMQLIEASESSQEMDEGLRIGDTGQMKEHFLKDK